MLIAIHNKFLSSEMPELDSDSEIIWARIQRAGCKDLRICAFYNPKTSGDLSAFETSVKRACGSNSQVLIGGDFNLPGWDWKGKVLKPGTQNTKNHYHLAEILDDNGLTQMVEIPTRNDAILDLFITNIPSKVQQVDTTTGISDHDIVYMEIDTDTTRNTQKPRKILLYKKANWKSMAEEMKLLHATIKQEEEEGATVDKIWMLFRNTLETVIDRHIPTKTARQKDKLPWITRDIRSLIKKRDRAYKRKKKTNHMEDIKKYKDLKHQVQR